MGGGVSGYLPAGAEQTNIYAATGNPPIFAFKTAPPAPRCPVGSKMKKVLNPVFDGVQRAVNDHLSKMTLADLQAQIA